MLPRKFLVPLRTEFLKIRKTGHWRDFPDFRALVAPNDLDYRRFAVIVNKKVSPLSTQRHRIKRLFMDEITKLNRSNQTKNQDMVFLLKPQSIKSTREEVNNQLTTLFT